jgi:cytochrome b6-f complex iron-sulfur subunit
MSQQEGQEMNRRDFVSAAAAAAAGLGVLAGACGSALGQAASQPSDSAETIDVGPKSDFTKDGPVMTWVKEKHIIVCREEGKIYAMTSKCTHKGCDLDDGSTGFTCNCHNSAFSYDGKVTQGPARRALPRYGITVNSDGHVIVDTKKTYTESKWDDAASYITAS